MNVILVLITHFVIGIMLSWHISRRHVGILIIIFSFGYILRFSYILLKYIFNVDIIFYDEIRYGQLAIYFADILQNNLWEGIWLILRYSFNQLFIFVASLHLMIEQNYILPCMLNAAFMALASLYVFGISNFLLKNQKYAILAATCFTLLPELILFGSVMHKEASVIFATSGFFYYVLLYVNRVQKTKVLILIGFFTFLLIMARIYLLAIYMAPVLIYLFRSKRKGIFIIIVLIAFAFFFNPIVYKMLVEMKFIEFGKEALSLTQDQMGERNDFVTNNGVIGNIMTLFMYLLQPSPVHVLEPLRLPINIGVGIWYLSIPLFLYGVFKAFREQRWHIIVCALILLVFWYSFIQPSQADYRHRLQLYIFAIPIITLGVKHFVRLKPYKKYFFICAWSLSTFCLFGAIISIT